MFLDLQASLLRFDPLHIDARLSLLVTTEGSSVIDHYRRGAALWMKRGFEQMGASWRM